jgi:poly-gamma-glutamate capsule biosynthesis protein CapA/YwtB (metallophosphatase superfamily)
MSSGRVYLWTPDSHELLGGHVEKAVVPLPGLTADAAGKPRLSGRLVSVRNGGWVNIPDSEGGIRAVHIGDAQPDDLGNFCFEPGRGGGRMDKDKVTLADADFRLRYIQASHFGEVNTYYHLHRIASYVEALLKKLGAPKLPQVIAVVNAHHAATEQNGVRDGELSPGRWKAFQGGHYRLPGRRFHIDELHPVAETGEIHLGPGRQLLADGALVRLAGDRYRANASHNAGIIYHEYGHHITRHAADFRGNALKSPQSQDNRKTALDEGTCDYWTAAMLETPHIWAWHRRHDEQEVHARSLVSRKTMADFDAGPKANPHTNGTIWAAGLWDLRAELKRSEDDGARKCDLLVLKTLLLIGQIEADGVRELRRLRADYSRAMATLLEADKGLYSGRHQSLILECFSRRRIFLPRMSAGEIRISSSNPAASRLLKRVSLEEIPADEDLCSGAELESYLQERNEPPLSVLAVGDIMLGERTRKVIREEGADYPFAGVVPLLHRSEIVFGNQEGPFAGEAVKADRNFSYRVNPRLATALTRANVNVVTLANNHLTDCGRAGVLETLAALNSAGVAVVGAAENKRTAHRPVIRRAGRWRVGLLGYYWNRRTAATSELPGSAMDTPEDLRADIGALRRKVDRVVVEFHWGIPYEREPLTEDREKARLAVDCGADVVVGHHPHVIQPLEVYCGCPIFYSVGNFAFGSGNSLAEGLMVGFRFEEEETEVQVYSLYVKNRDPRVNYQPKVLRGSAGRRTLQRLAEMSGENGRFLTLETGRAVMRLPASKEGSSRERSSREKECCA